LKTSEIVIIVLVTVSLGAGGVFAVLFSPPQSPCSGVIGAIRSFTIIADSTGYNGSQYQAGPWPVVTVQRCDHVVFNVINKATESHGFAVAYYSNAGLELVGEANQKLEFQASKAGQFKLYCTIPCSVHNLMLNGLLTIT